MKSKNNLSDKIAKLGLSQKEFAEQVGYTTQTISRIKSSDEIPKTLSLAIEALENRYNKQEISLSNEMMTWDDIDNIPEAQHIISGLEIGSVGSIIAPGGLGKSYLALSIAASLGSKKDIVGLKTDNKTYKTCYLSAEESIKELAKRSRSLLSLFENSDQERIKSNVHIFSLAGKSPSLLNKNGIRNLDWVKFVKAEAAKVDLIIIDTLNKFHRGDENSVADVTELTELLFEIGNQCNCAVLVLHHANKLSQQQGTTSDQSASRGSSALTDNVRFQLNLVGMTSAEAKEYQVNKQDFIKIVGPKTNYTSAFNSEIWLKRNDGGALSKTELKKTKKTKLSETKTDLDVGLSRFIKKK